MHSELAQIVLKVQNLSHEERPRVIDALLQLEGVNTATVDVYSGVVKVDGAATDAELLNVLRSLGKHAVVVTHTRGVAAGRTRSPPSASGVRMQLFLKLVRRQLDCCS